MNSWTWITPSWSESAAWNKAWAFFVPTPICLKTSRRGTCFFGQKHEACTTTTPKEKGYPFFGSPNKKWNQKTSYSRDFDLQLKVDADLQSSVTITKPTSILQNASYISLPFSFLSRHICRRCSAVLDYVSRPQLHISTHPTSLPHWKEKAIGKWPSHHPSSLKKTLVKGTLNISSSLRTPSPDVSYFAKSSCKRCLAAMTKSAVFGGNLQGPQELFGSKIEATGPTETLRQEIKQKNTCFGTFEKANLWKKAVVLTILYSMHKTELRVHD